MNRSREEMLVEEMARALCKACGRDPDAILNEVPWWVYRQVEGRACAAIAQKLVNELEAAVSGILTRAGTTFKARNGRNVGIQGDDGEMCWIVHSDDIEALRAALPAMLQRKR